ncbi:MAG: zinc-ribbon domain containing protein [Patescibacteria group bacterium]
MSTCKNCQQQFTIYPEDQAFYTRMGVPEPTRCPECRQQRRLVWRNEKTLYQRKSDLTGKDIISIYSPESSYKVYDAEEWHGDKWEAMDYGRDFDYSRPFFDQFGDLQKQVPRPARAVIKNINSDYVNQCWNLKNGYMCFDVGFAENVMYCAATYHTRDCLDCFFARGSELSYYLVDSQNCFDCAYLQDCGDCHEAFFSFDCKGCNNIAFCFNLRNQRNYIYNKPVSQDEFANFIQELKQGSFQKHQEYVKKWRQDVINQSIHKLHHNIKTVNCSGDYILNSKNCHHCYNIDACEDLRYCNRMDEQIYNCLDLDHCSICESIYEGLVITGNNLKFCINSWSPSTDCWYSDLTMSCQNCFGCVGLKHKKYCVLNKQYTEQEYAELVVKIIVHMKKTGEFGELYPPKLSPFAYNETVAPEYYPLTRDEAINSGYRWQDNLPGTFSKETIKPENLPDKIIDVADSITKEILVCVSCGKNYKIISQEFGFYKDRGIPLPRQCFICRNKERISFRNPQKLWQRKCDQCGKEIQTTYPINYPSKVYCEGCYEKEIY